MHKCAVCFGIYFVRVLWNLRIDLGHGFLCDVRSSRSFPLCIHLQDGLVSFYKACDWKGR